MGFVGLLILAGISELLTLVAFNSDICSSYNCTFATSAGFAIGSSLASFTAAKCFYKATTIRQDFSPATPVFDVEAPGTVTVQETVSPDGTKKTVKTTVNADGSKTVEETVVNHQVSAYVTLLASVW
jgi:hypothetical protein